MSALLAALRQREALHPIETAKNERRFISIDAVPRTESTGEFVKLYCRAWEGGSGDSALSYRTACFQACSFGLAPHL